MLWKPRQRDTFTAYTACEASDNAELQSGQILSVSVSAETRPFRENMRGFIVNLFEFFLSEGGYTPPFKGLWMEEILHRFYNVDFLQPRTPSLTLVLKASRKQICSNDGNLAPPQTEQLSILERGCGDASSRHRRSL